ncbi:MAG: hypothetical protein HFH16_04415 [Ruminococcus sp.]|jgi:hypothetical protein|uniref:DUF3237 family protein n=1 Tax=Schaedlerella arabinosiphila TaxID=2044587 RepID=A0A426DDE9_9FIRM|nr:hypothetical protein [Schaedlerella arabinosiphila]MCI8722952.1 hypothetical protein [Ruminococcus sp.]RRK30741.1 hypothetical protein EBB54_04620 [Schaedlerella arabinosiphila]
MEKLIMKIQVFGEGTPSDLQSPYGCVTFVPFTAKVESELFTGETLPGAVDVQVETPDHVRNMCAKYMFQGKDFQGNDCKLYVENNGYLQPMNRQDPHFNAVPRFLTDSPALGAYLCRQRFRSEVQGMDWGVEIRIFDVLA